MGMNAPEKILAPSRRESSPRRKRCASSESLTHHLRHRLEEDLLAREVPVGHAVLDAQRGGEPAHRQVVDARFVE
jgi:hypothetical protein